MTVIRAHYDGKVIIPSEPVDLPQGRVLLFHVADSGDSTARPGVSGESLLRFSGAVATDDIERMKQAISEGFEQINVVSRDAHFREIDGLPVTNW
jgi:hypothetical protein